MGVLDELKTTLGIGARTNKYKVIINGVGGGPSGPIADVLAVSTTIPARSFADVEVWIQGRLVTIAGDATFNDSWSVTFMDDEEHTLRGKFIDWMEYIDSVAKNSRGAADHSSYMTTALVQQLSTIDNSKKAEYTFNNLYPKSLSDSVLSDMVGELLKFTVEFNYTHWEKTG